MEVQMIDIIIHVHGGVIWDIVSSEADKVTVTLVDDDEIEQGETDIYRGNYPVSPMLRDFRDSILMYVEEDDVQIYDENGDLL